MLDGRYDDLTEGVEVFYQEQSDNLRQLRRLTLRHKLQHPFKGDFAVGL